MTGLIRTTEPASRGRVRCDNCHRPIARGVHYTRDPLADAGDIWDWRTCPACAPGTSAGGRMRAPPPG